jgi:uncharacterized repeat protein (TIGR03803 family)
MTRLSTFFVASALTLTGIASLGTQSAHAQTFRVIHTFTGEAEGSHPSTGLTLDRAGNLYGTTIFGLGTVFQLKETNGSWQLNTLYAFGVNVLDADTPMGRTVFGSDGTLYGTTFLGGSGRCPGGCGAVYALRPPRTTCRTAVCPWTETVLYSFTGGADGSQPQSVELVFDRAGNLYGTTPGGGSNGYGVVFKLSPAGGRWTESVIHSFNGQDGIGVVSGVTLDTAGNLYGTTVGGGLHGQGNVYQLAPSGLGWTTTTLYSFQDGNDGEGPVGGLIIDQSANLYGTTMSGGSGGGGTVFELSPSGGSWTYALLYGLSGCFVCGPRDNLVMDTAGSLYGTTYAEGTYGQGSVFKLTPTNDGWTYTSLHDFTGGSDGANPVGGPTLDANGNVYGTTYYGGGNCSPVGCGVVWEITP